MRHGRSALLILVSLAAARGHAATLTVGPTGDYSTVQAAVTHAVTLPGWTYVHVASGVFPERIVIPRMCCGSTGLSIKGGWNASFTTQTANPSLTVLDGGGAGRTVSLPDVSSGTVYIANLTIRGGRLRVGAGGRAEGAGLNAQISGGAGLWMQEVHVRQNTITAAKAGVADAAGAGAFVTVHDWSRFLVQKCVFEQNRMTESGGARLRSHGAGLSLQLFDGGSAVRDSRFVANVATGSEWSSGGGMEAMVRYVSGVGITVEDNLFEANMVSGLSGGSGLHLWAGDGIGATNLDAQRNRLLGNRGGRAQIVATSYNQGVVDIQDSLVVQGDRGGVQADSTGGVTRVTNLTVADNDGVGIRARTADGDVSVFNSIAFSNGGGELVLELASYAGSNLIGIDPRFVDPAGGNYQPSWSSPVIDAGDDTPPGGLSALDLDKGPRVERTGVDIGAYEVP